MANQLSPELLAQLYGQTSGDPFLTLVTLSHETFSADIHLVNNTKNITSLSRVFEAFPMKIQFPVDDGQTAKEFTITFDNASLELLEQIRAVTTQIGVKIEMILASMPDAIQIVQDDLLLASVTYDSQKITAKIILDNFLNVEMTCERYNPNNFPGIF